MGTGNLPQVHCPTCFGWILADPAEATAKEQTTTSTVWCVPCNTWIPLHVGMTWLYGGEVA